MGFNSVFKGLKNAWIKSQMTYVMSARALRRHVT